MTADWPPGGVTDSMSVAPQPFPVTVPFRMRVDLQRLEVDAGECAGLLVSDGQYAAGARLKLAHLGDLSRPLVGIAPGADEARIIAALRAAMRTLGQWHPALIGLPVSEYGGHFCLHQASLRLSADGPVNIEAQGEVARPVAARLAALSPSARCLAALALGVQEDLVLMGWPNPFGLRDSLTDDSSVQGLVALAVSVVQPSGWVPLEKLGLPLAAIHMPVAHGEPLRDASLNLSRAMVDKGPFERFVWTLATDAAPARWPGATGAAASCAADLSDLFFRTERQVMLGLPAHGASLFLVRVQVAPLNEAAPDAQRRSQLVAALRSMSDDVVAYKNIGTLRDRVCAAWGQAEDKEIR